MSFGVTFLGNAVRVFTERAVKGMEADEERARTFVEMSLALVTALVPVVGYDQAAEIAQGAVREGKTVRQVCLEMGMFSPKELDRILDPWGMTEPGMPSD